MCFASAANADRLILADVNVVNVLRAPPLSVDESATVIIENERIQSILDAEDYQQKMGDRVVECHGRYLVPGLCDMHVHLDDPLDLTVFVAHGVTLVRDMDGSPHTLALRENVKKGELFGPTVVAASPQMDVDPQELGYFRPRGYGGVMKEGTTAEAKAAVRQWHKAGYDGVKVYSNLPPDVYAAILDEARKVGLPVWGHVPHQVPLVEALKRGQKSVEHMLGWEGALVPALHSLSRASPVTKLHRLNEAADGRLIDPLVALAKESRVFHVPTFMARIQRGFGPRDMLQGPFGLVSRIKESYWRANRLAKWASNDERQRWVAQEKRSRRTLYEVVGKLQAAEAGVLAGSDYGVPFLIPGLSLHQELERLVEAGLTAWEALRSATILSAQFLDRGDSGAVAKGRIADLVVLNANPLEGIDAIRQIQAVVLRGQYLSRERLDAELARVRREQADFAPFRNCPHLPRWREVLWRDDFLARVADVRDQDTFATVGGERLVVGRTNGKLEAAAQLSQVMPSRHVIDVRLSLTDDWQVARLDVRFTSAWTRKRVRCRRVRAGWEITITDGRNGATPREEVVLDGDMIQFPSILSHLVVVKSLSGAVGEARRRGPYIRIDALGRVYLNSHTISYKKVSSLALLSVASDMEAAYMVTMPARDDGERILFGLNKGGWPMYLGVNDSLARYKDRFYRELRRREPSPSHR